MAQVTVSPVDLTSVEQLVTTADAVIREALDVARRRTDGGKGIDDAQVHCERLAYAATELAAAKELLTYAKSAHEHGHADPVVDEMAAAFAAEVAQRLAGNVDTHIDEFGLGDDFFNDT